MQEAINCIDDVLNSDYHYDEILGYQLTSDDFEWLEKAKEALEKRTPKKPTVTTHKYRQENTEELGEYKLTHCPYCFWEDKELGYFDSLVDKGTKYCRRCGQALDWTDHPTEKGGEG